MVTRKLIGHGEPIEAGVREDWFGVNEICTLML